VLSNPPLPLPINTVTQSADGLDADGKNDIAVANSDSNSVSIFWGQGDGTFGEETILRAAPEPYIVEADDVNGDGLTDLIVATGTSCVSVLLGQVGRGFDPPTNYGVGNFPRDMKVMDLDFDGFPEIITMDYYSTTISFLGNNTVGDIVSVGVFNFAVYRTGQSALIRLAVPESSVNTGFHVYRQQLGAKRERLTDQLLTGQTEYEFIDPTPPREGAEYWLAEIGHTGETTWHGPAVLPPVSLPARLTLGPGVPNPFRSQTQITYSIPGSQHVELVIYDLQGRRIAILVDEDQGPGEYTVSWGGRVDTGMAASGLYFLRLRAGKATKTQKLMFVR